MKKSVIITADSSADLPLALRDELDVHLMPISIQIEDRTGKDGVDITSEDILEAFYERGAMPKTAAPSLGEYQDFFGQFDGCAVVHLSIGQNYSSCHQIAQLAAQNCEDVYVVDSMNVSVASGILCVKAAELRDAGMEAAEIARRISEMRGSVRACFILNQLDFVAKGGRVPALLAFGANLFKLRPVVITDGSTGKIAIGKKYRGPRRNCYERFLQETCESLKETIDPSWVFFLRSPGMAQEEVGHYEALAKELLPGVKHFTPSTSGCAITSHCGANCIGLVGLKREAEAAQ